MAAGNLRKRTYDSGRRQAQAEATRHHILEAARLVFSDRGYAGATMQAIAAEAGVSLPTIYANFKNKPRVLVALFNFASSAGGEENVPMLQRAAPQAVARETNPRRRVRMFAETVADNLSRAAPISEIMEDAARTETVIQAILERLNSQRLEHMTFAVKQIIGNAPAVSDRDLSPLRDIVWTLTSPEVFLLLTRGRGWSKEKYQSWLEDELTHALLS